MDKLMTYQEVARQLGLSVRFIAKLVSLDEIPSIKIGKSVRFNPDLIQKWLEMRSNEALEYSTSGTAVSMKSGLTIIKCRTGAA